MNPSPPAFSPEEISCRLSAACQEPENWYLLLVLETPPCSLLPCVGLPSYLLKINLVLQDSATLDLFSIFLAGIWNDCLNKPGQLRELRPPASCDSYAIG